MGDFFTGIFWLDAVMVIALIYMIAKLAFYFYVGSKSDRIAYTCIAAFILAAYVIITLTYRPSEPFKPYW